MVKASQVVALLQLRLVGKVDEVVAVAVAVEAKALPAELCAGLSTWKLSHGHRGLRSMTVMAVTVMAVKVVLSMLH